MEVGINKENTPADIAKKLKVFSEKISGDRKIRLSKFFGILKLNGDALRLQKSWRD